MLGEPTWFSSYYLKSLFLVVLWLMNCLLKNLVKLEFGIQLKIRLFNKMVQYKMPRNTNKLKRDFQTVWEIKQKDVIDMASDRGY
jgi:hypothetical protein